MSRDKKHSFFGAALAGVGTVVWVVVVWAEGIAAGAQAPMTASVTARVRVERDMASLLLLIIK
jgi:hypothetical protein